MIKKITLYCMFLSLLAILTTAQDRGKPPKKEGPGSGPFNDEIYLATSKDGLKWESTEKLLCKHASVPDIVELERDCDAGKKRTLLVYFVDFSTSKGPASEGISVIKSEDGKNWSKPIPIKLNGKRNKGAPVDPSIIHLKDKKLQLFYFGSEMTEGDPAMQSGSHKIYSATSKDGIEFDVDEGIRYEEEKITDPEIVVSDTEWFMFLSRGDEVLLAHSKDGKTFTRDNEFLLRKGGVPGAVILEDGKIRIFQSLFEGIKSVIWNPKKNDKPEPEEGIRIEKGKSKIAADPAVIRCIDGTFLMIYKRSN